MGQVTITIDKREYVIACGDGQEAHIIELSRVLDEKAKQLAGLGSLNENLKLAMIGLVLADELADIKAGKPVQISTEKLEMADSATAVKIDEQTTRIGNLIKEIRSL
ncbi:MAG: cell division protein ZapA [Alphaproteobacteria bacterium]|nr:cell division protein ZapA [Alphaproteobacteria bacterium]